MYFNPYSEEEFRIYLPEGDHVFRAGFIDDHVRDRRCRQEGRVQPAEEQVSRRDHVHRTVPVEDREGEPEEDSLLRSRVGPRVRRTIVARSRAARLPPAADAREVDSLLRFVDLAKANGQSVEQGLQLAIQAMLVSPNFLFRIERDPDPRDPALVHEVSPFELASRFSYFLWSSMPDDELLTLAESGRLRDPRVLEAQVKRMLADPRAAAFAANFAGQWLETRNLDVVKPDPEKFPEWDPDLRDAMKTETAMFFEHVLRENRPVSDFLNADYTFLNERLADALRHRRRHRARVPPRDVDRRIGAAAS